MRAYALLSIALALTACSNTQQNRQTASPTPSGSPLPLRTCEARQLTLDGVDLLIVANVDATPGTVTVLHAPDEAAAQKALADEHKLFGQEHRDMRTQSRPWKDGLIQIVDMCGNLATYNPPTTPAPSPSQK